MGTQMSKLSKKSDILSPYICLLLQTQREFSSKTQGAKNQSSRRKQKLRHGMKLSLSPPKQNKPWPKIHPAHLREVLQGQVSLAHEEIGFEAVLIALR